MRRSKSQMHCPSPEAAAPSHTFTTKQFRHAVIATNLLAEKSKEQVSAERGCETEEIPTALFVRAGEGGSGKRDGGKGMQSWRGRIVGKARNEA